MSAVVRTSSRFGWIHLKQHAPYLVTMSGLFCVGFLGHSLHWSIPRFGGEAVLGETNVNVADSANSVQPSSSVTEFIGDQKSTEGLARPSENPDSSIVLKSAESRELAGIEVESVDVQVLTKAVVASAEVQYDRRHTIGLSSRVPGVIHRVLCQWGQQVRAGEILAVVEAGEVGQLKSDFAKALSERNLKQRTFERLKSASHAISHGQLLEAEGALQVATVTLLSAEQALVNLGFQLTIDEFTGLPEDEVNLRLRTLGFDGELLTAIGKSTSSSNLLPICSPIDGVIIENDAALGESVSSEKSFMQVSDVSRVWVTIHVRKEDAASIRIGQNVSFSPDGWSVPVEGKISWISTEVDEKTRTLRIRAEVTNPKLSDGDGSAIDGYALRANMYGVAEIEICSETAVAVSKDCLHMDNGQTIIFVQTASDTFEPRAVKCGVSENDMVAVTGPVAAGSKVASRGSQLLKSELVLSRTSERE